MKTGGKYRRRGRGRKPNRGGRGTAHTPSRGGRATLDRPPGGRIVVPNSALDGYPELITDGLTFSQLRSKLNAAVRGDLAMGLNLASEMEAKDGRLRSVANTRRRSLTGLAWEVTSAADVQEENVDRVLADEAAALVRESFTNLPNWRKTLKHLATGIGPNLAVAELIWSNRTLVDTQTVWPQRLIMDPRQPGLVRVITPEERAGIAAEQPKFVVHTPDGEDLFPFRRSLARPQALLFLIKALAVADWAVFCEIFGMPVRTGTYQPGASAEEKRELVDMLQNLGTKAWGAFSSNVQLQLLESSQRGTSPYQGLAEYCARETAILWLGGNLTTDNTGATGSLAAGVVQDEVKDDLRDDDIETEGETVRTQIIAPMCRYAYWREDVPLPYFGRVKPEVIDRIQEADLIGKAQMAGITIPLAWAHKRLGIPEPQDGEATLSPSLDLMGQGISEGMEGDAA